MKCPECSVELVDTNSPCPDCGYDVSDEMIETAVQPAEHTPTEIKSTDGSSNIHNTTSDGSRFVAGTILAARYRILGILGKGGMGEVYKAEDLELDQIVALKFLPAEFAQNESFLKRFRGEVRTARQISHPNVCRVFDIGETEGQYYLTMEYIKGDDLSILLKRIGRFPSDRAVEISRQICMGLQAVHDAGILHRDLKPANIIVDSEGNARITDFGIAGIEEDVQGAEARVGTPAYMSPEQISGKEVTKKSDIYSLGLLLYEVFTGKQAFTGDTLADLQQKHQTAAPTNASEIVTGIDPLAEDLILKCLEKDPKDRPSSALQVAATLPGGDPLKVALEAGQTPTPEMIAAAPSKGRLKPAVALGLLAGFAALLFLVGFFQSEYKINAQAPLDKSQDALAERARTVIKDVGYSEDTGNEWHEFGRDGSYLRHVREQPQRKNWWEKLKNGQPAFYHFLYRRFESDITTLGRAADVSARNPPMNKPGMISVRLDVTGRLMRFEAVPEAEAKKTTEDAKTDWGVLFDAAGLKIGDFKEVESKWNPTQFADESVQWQGFMVGDKDVPVRINGAGLHGKPVLFEIVPSWREPAGAVQSQIQASGPRASEIFILVLFLSAILGSALLVRFNVKNGRGDVMGAVKIAGFCCLLTFISAAFTADTGTGIGAKLFALFVGLSEALLVSSFIFLFYLSIEPFIRKRFPEVFISWNRLLSGDFKNPMVGRDVLVGSFLSLVLALIGVGLAYLGYLTKPSGVFDPFGRGSISPLNGPVGFFGELIQNPVSGVLNSFFVMFLLLISSLVLKKKWMAIIGAGLILSLQALLASISQGDWVLYVNGLFFVAIWLLCIVRFGALAAVSFYMFIDLMQSALITLDTNDFYFSSTLILFGFSLVLCGYAAYVSMSGQKLFEKGLFEEGG